MTASRPAGRPATGPRADGAAPRPSSAGPTPSGSWPASEHSKTTGSFVDPSLGRRTFGEYAESWLATKANLAARTRINVERRLRNHLLPRFGNEPIARIEPADVRSWVATLTERGLAPGTVRAIYLVLAQIMPTAEVDRVITRSPCLGIRLPRASGRDEMCFLSADQVTRPAEAIGPRYRTLIYAAAYTGLRAGELAALKVDRRDFVRRTIDVVESLSEVRGKLVTGPTKTRARRTVTMPLFLAEMLAEHLEMFPSPSGYVFTSEGGGPLRHHNFYVRQFRLAVRRAGLPHGLRFHDLRHTAASLLISRGANPKQIQERLGHSTIQLTFDRYGHLFEGHDEALLTALDATFAESRVSDPCPRPAIRVWITDTEARKKGRDLGEPWSGRRDSNPRPSPWQGEARPAALRGGSAYGQVSAPLSVTVRARGRPQLTVWCGAGVVQGDGHEGGSRPRWCRHCSANRRRGWYVGP